RLRGGDHRGEFPALRASCLHCQPACRRRGRRHQAGGLKMIRKQHWPIHLALGIVAALMLVPFYWVLHTSLAGENIFVYPPAILPENTSPFYFVDVWYAIPFFRYLINSVVVAVIVVVANVFLHAMAGYALTRDFPGKA